MSQFTLPCLSYLYSCLYLCHTEPCHTELCCIESYHADLPCSLRKEMGQYEWFLWMISNNARIVWTKPVCGSPHIGRKGRAVYLLPSWEERQAVQHGSLVQQDGETRLLKVRLPFRLSTWSTKFMDQWILSWFISHDSWFMDLEWNLWNLRILQIL